MPMNHVVVLADGAPVSRPDLDAAWPGWDRGISAVVAADGGARSAISLELRIDAWVGDGDSLDAGTRDALRAAGVVVSPVAREKDESDTELAILEAVRRGADEITILGGLGGMRADHALANVTLLAHPALAGRPARLLDASTRISLVGPGGELGLVGRIGDTVTLLPLGGPADEVTVSGLRYPLSGDRLELGSTRGLSNVRTAPQTRIAVGSGRLLVVESPATLRS